MSEKTYTIKELKVMNSSTKWNHRIIIPSNANTSIKWKLQFTWKNSGDIMNNKGSTGFGLTLIADFINKYFKN